MKDPNLYFKIRTKKLGLLLYDARLVTGKSISDCAKITGIPLEKLSDFEAGLLSPTLPELEILSYFYKIPLEHFWGNEILSENDQEQQAKKFKQLISIRHRMIGANIKTILDERNIQPEDFAKSLGLNPDQFQNNLSGDEEIPVPLLEMISKNLDCRIEDFFDTQGMIGRWRAEIIESQRLKEIPYELRDFISKPINVPYIELAIRLSELDVNKLRAVAEGLLEITL